MLRLRPDHAFEFQLVETLLAQVEPAPLTESHRAALHARIFSRMGAQEPPLRGPGGLPGLRPAWIAIPAGVGIAAAIVAATHYGGLTGAADDAQSGHSVAQGSVLIDGVRGSDLRPGQTLLTVSPTWLAFGAAVRIGLEPGARVRNESDGAHIQLRILTGHVTVAAQGGGVTLIGAGWSAVVAPGSAGTVTVTEAQTVVQAMEGNIVVQSNGRSHTLMANSPALVVPAPATQPVSGGAGATGDPAGATLPAGNVINPGVTPAAAPPALANAEAADENPSDVPTPVPSGQPAATPPSEGGTARGASASSGNGQLEQPGLQPTPAVAGGSSRASGSQRPASAGTPATGAGASGAAAAGGNANPASPATDPPANNAGTNHGPPPAAGSPSSQGGTGRQTKR